MRKSVTNMEENPVVRDYNWQYECELMAFYTHNRQVPMCVDVLHIYSSTYVYIYFLIVNWEGLEAMTSQ